jgi:hypothetical protein
MATLLICPECGGVRGATETTEAGRPCTCSNPSPSGTVYGAVPGSKICCICGADVTGKRRYKDREGRYFCPDCNMLDAERKEAAPPPPSVCGECQKTFPREELAEENGQLICEPCRTEKIAREKRERARIAAAEAEAELMEKRKKVLIAVSIAMAVLLVVMVVVLNLR